MKQLFNIFINKMLNTAKNELRIKIKNLIFFDVERREDNSIEYNIRKVIKKPKLFFRSNLNVI
jgi:hypothetical protein